MRNLLARDYPDVTEGDWIQTIALICSDLCHATGVSECEFTSYMNYIDEKVRKQLGIPDGERAIEDIELRMDVTEYVTEKYMNDESYRCSYCGKTGGARRVYANATVVCSECTDRHREAEERSIVQSIGPQMMAQSIGMMLISGEIDGAKAEELAKVAREMQRPTPKASVESVVDKLRNTKFVDPKCPPSMATRRRKRR